VHQAGIDTAVPAFLTLAAFDLRAPDAASLRDLLRRWSDAAENLTAGRPLNGTGTGAGEPPADSEETTGKGPKSLTLTFGLGPAVFDRRYGLSGRRPAGLRQLPTFRGDRLREELTGGDLLVQACAEDPTVTFHAVRALTGLAGTDAQLRWQQNGFGAAASHRFQTTPRNLFGQLDGTANPIAGTSAFDSAVWVSDDPPWLRGGSHLVVRRIRMDLQRWDNLPLNVQERMIGRAKDSGAPLTGGDERTAPDFAARDSAGRLIIAEDSHIRLASPAFHGGAAMLRRGYSYDAGIDPRTGAPDAGLLFLAYVADIDRQYIPVQQALADRDQLNAVTTVTGSAVFVIPPGWQPGQYGAHTLFT
jgi:deferrochelatase/peroxidase EfeB